jgi:eukaryotic-like serine/threonine-protein kinase
MLLTPGTLVTPEIRLTRPLGSGAMGTIWGGEHLKLGRAVAVKFISAELLRENPDARERFDREAMVLQGFRHPHVVELIANGTSADGTPYIVLELMNGEPLIERLERDGVFELDALRMLLDQLAGALDSLHQRGVVHRDIKAENLFIEGTGAALKVKLFDFGLARVGADATTNIWGKLTKAGMRVGTNEYMSPEQMLSAADANHTADLWATAVVAYLLLVASFPFQGKKVAELFALIGARRFERPSAVRDDVPRAVDEWFERAFHPDLSKRYASAKELASAFHAALAAPAGAPQPAVPPPPPQRAPAVPTANTPSAPQQPSQPQAAPSWPEQPTPAAPPSAPSAAGPVSLPGSLPPELRPGAKKRTLWIALAVAAALIVAIMAIRFLA